jgi:hypothetical protein
VEKIVRLRGHHILCLLGFRGLGYSPEFVENMTRVHARVFSHGAVVEIALGQDDICALCPRRDESRCRDGQSDINAKDSKVFDLLMLVPGERLSSEELYRRVASSLTIEDHARICGKCKWASLGYCSDGLRQLEATLRKG